MVVVVVVSSSRLNIVSDGASAAPYGGEALEAGRAAVAQAAVLRDAAM